MIENRKTFFDRLKNRFNLEDIALIEFAYDLAKEAHRTQKRYGGERYFEHPRAGCIILMDELDIYEKDMLIAFLFHDVGEDTPLLGNRLASYDDFLEKASFRLGKIFGKNVASMVITLTKPEVDNKRFFSKDEAFSFYVENLPTNEDALIGKMVDRLHNLRSLLPTGCAVSKITKQIIETESVYLPLFKSIKGKREYSAQLLLQKIEQELAVLKASI